MHKMVEVGEDGFLTKGNVLCLCTWITVQLAIPNAALIGIFWRE